MRADLLIVSVYSDLCQQRLAAINRESWGQNRDTVEKYREEAPYCRRPNAIACLPARHLDAAL